MTFEDFRARLNSGPTVEELKVGFEKHIADIVNQTVDKRDDLNEIKEAIKKLNDDVKQIWETLKTISEKLEKTKQT